MEHRHDGKKFKSKVRPWYAYQNPRVGRDVKRDKDPDKTPWTPPEFEAPDENSLVASNDSSMGEDDFMGDEFYDGSGEGDLEDGSSEDQPEDSFLGDDEEFYEDEEEDDGSKGKRKRKKKRKGEEEEPQKEEEKGDPWDIEFIEEDDKVLEDLPPKPEKEEEKDTEEDKKEDKKDKKDRKEDRKDRKEKEKEEEEDEGDYFFGDTLEEEEEEDDGGF